MRFHQFFISVFFVSRARVHGGRTLSISQNRTPVAYTVHDPRTSVTDGFCLSQADNAILNCDKWTQKTK